MEVATFQLETHQHYATGCRMGLAPPEARIGDLVYWLPSIDHALIVRATNSSCQIVGTALVACQLSNLESGFLESRFPSVRKNPKRIKIWPKAEEHLLHMDIAVAYALMK